MSAGKIAMLTAGQIEHVGSPAELYDAPCVLLVAGFIGSPKMNLIDSHEARVPGAHVIDVVRGI